MNGPLWTHGVDPELHVLSLKSLWRRLSTLQMKCQREADVAKKDGLSKENVQGEKEKGSEVEKKTKEKECKKHS